MSSVRVLVGTRKGAFVLSADGKRRNWKVEGPFFAGMQMYHLKGSPADPNRIYASQTSDWFGQIVQRSDDGGSTWKPVGNKFAYDGTPGTHQWYDGTPHPWEFKRVWHMEPSLTDPDTVYAGVEDAALFRSTDGGESWEELSGLRGLGGTDTHAQLAARRRRHGTAHHHSRSHQSGAHVHCHFRGRRLPHRRWRQELEADQQGPGVELHARPDRRGRPLRAPCGDAPGAARACCSCRSTGT